MKDVMVYLTKENGTYLHTLYGKPFDSRIENSIRSDTMADEVVQHIAFDFENLKIVKGASISLPVKAKHVDQWTRRVPRCQPGLDSAKPGMRVGYKDNDQGSGEGSKILFTMSKGKQEYPIH